MAHQIQLPPSQAKADAGQGGHDIDDNLGYLVNRTARLMAQMFSRRLQGHGVALAQWAILLFLYANDGQTQRELSRVVAIEPPTVARTIDRMVRDGLVRREPHPHDGRATRIRLTPHAQALREELAAESRAGNQLAARVLSVEELQTLKTLLRRVIDGLTSAEGEQRSTPTQPGA
ncbi:MAG TPA: MarR family winged helix-turn-helix transcriptional regulator [Actinomycetes bacterium]|jgi:DNA-binding MarR family transcriptional regulator|nr:MarR family winged helix-turn-helix transcriptional regulator [Actinomycetes bacterium]